MLEAHQESQIRKFLKVEDLQLSTRSLKMISEYKEFNKLGEIERVRMIRQ